MPLHAVHNIATCVRSYSYQYSLLYSYTDISVRSVIRSTVVASYVADINTLLASYSARERNKVITMFSVQWQMPIVMP